MANDGDDEFDVDMMDFEAPGDAECTEYVGAFTDFESFARQAVETLVMVDGLWLLDCLDWARVEEAMTAGGRYRYRVDGGRLLRDTLY